MRTFAQKTEAAKQTTSAKFRKPSRPFFGQSCDASSILHLQRTIGNQAVLRFLQTEKDKVDINSANHASNGFAHDFSQMPVRTTTSSAVQTNLRTNAPRDRYEQEADRIADQVLRQKIPREQMGQRVDIQTTASHQSTEDEHEVSEDLEKRLSRSKGGGNPISDQVRAFVETRLQFDFSKVRVHTNNEAAQISRDLSARAFTFGRDIYFGAEQYSPHSNDGRQLLAHEMVHVLQQSQTTPSIQRQVRGTGSQPPQQVRINWSEIWEDVQQLRPDLYSLITSLRLNGPYREVARVQHGGRTRVFRLRVRLEESVQFRIQAVTPSDPRHAAAIQTVIRAGIPGRTRGFSRPSSVRGNVETYDVDVIINRIQPEEPIEGLARRLPDASERLQFLYTLVLLHELVHVAVGISRLAPDGTAASGATAQVRRLYGSFAPLLEIARNSGPGRAVLRGLRTLYREAGEPPETLLQPDELFEYLIEEKYAKEVSSRTLDVRESDEALALIYGTVVIQHRLGLNRRSQTQRLQPLLELFFEQLTSLYRLLSPYITQVPSPPELLPPLVGERESRFLAPAPIREL